jgi:hypothetical protein
MAQNPVQGAVTRSITTGPSAPFDLLRFIQGNVPYGRVTADDLQPGLIEVDNSTHYWIFAGQYHTIAKAIRIPYVYERQTPTGKSQPYGESVLVGYVDASQTSKNTAQNHGVASTGNLDSGELLNLLLQDQKKIKALAQSSAWASATVDLDGLARDYNAARPYPYTLQDVIADEDKYAQLLYWYFRGTFYRMTKVIRLSGSTGGALGDGLLIGYQGPSM